jgi:hypothetical protein
MLSLPVLIPIYVVVISLTVLQLRLARRYATERTTFRMPDGRPFDLLLNKDGVLLYRWWGARYAPLWAWIRERRGGPLPWAVRVRQSPWRGYKDLVHETYPTVEQARERIHELARLIEQGGRLWPPEWEW